MRGNAAEALGKIGQVTPDATAKLRATLSNEDTYFRAQAACALWRLHRDKEMIPLVLEIAKGSERSRLFAIVALGEIGPEAKAAVPYLCTVLNCEAGNERGLVASWEAMQAAMALWKIDKHRPAIVALAEMVHMKEGHIAADSLARIGSEAKVAIPALLKGLRNPNDEVRSSAARALWSINRHEAAIPALIQLLKNSPASTRAYTAKFLGEIGSGAKDAVPALTEALRDPSPFVRYSARVALRQVDPNAASKEITR